MNKKNMQIVVILIVVVIAIFVVLGFFGIGGLNFGALTGGQAQSQQASTQTGQAAAQALLAQVQQSGSVSTLQAVDVTVGTGDAVAAGDTVYVNYVGALPNGTVFDASQSHGGAQPFQIGVGKVIPGWDEGILGMKVGGERLLAIPSNLAYGAAGQGPIPPNSTLIFDVQVVKRVPAGTPVTGSSTPQTQPAK